jgi:hypothetical protein
MVSLNLLPYEYGTRSNICAFADPIQLQDDTSSVPIYVVLILTYLQDSLDEMAV